MSNFYKTRYNNIVYHNDKLFDESKIEYINPTSNNTYIIDNVEKPLDNILLPKRIYDKLPPYFKRLTVYNNHTFNKRLYYYNKELRQILAYKQDNSENSCHYLNLKSIESVFNLQADSGKSVRIVIDKIVDHEQN